MLAARLITILCIVPATLAAAASFTADPADVDADARLAEAAAMDAALDSLYGAGDFESGIELATEQAGIREEILGREDLTTAASLRRLARFKKAGGDYAGAEPIYREVLATRERLLGPEHLDIATSLEDLGVLLSDSGDYADAESLLREALAMNRRLLGDEHETVATNLDNLGTLLDDMGDYEAARALYREALAMRRRLLGARHRDVAWSLNNLAATLWNLGDYFAAEPLYRESLLILRENYGPEHQYVAWSLNNLGLLLKAQGDLAGAEACYREALAILRKVFGSEHDTVAACLSNLAGVLRAEGRVDEAEPHYREALAIRRRVLGDQHPMVALSKNNLALALDERGRHAEAERLFREALALHREVLGEDHPHVARSLHNLAGSLMSQGNFADAVPLLRESIERGSRVLGETHPYLALYRQRLGEALMALGDLAAAERELRRAAEIFEAARLRAGADIRRATFQESPYPVLALAQLALGRDEAAWESVERTSGRVLAELLVATDARTLTTEERERELQLKEELGTSESRLKALQKQMHSNHSEEARRQFDESRNGLLDAEARWDRLQLELAARHPLDAGRPPSLAEIQASLGKETALVGWLDEEKPGGGRASWVYLVRAGAPVRWRSLDTRRDDSEAGGDGAPASRSAAFREALSAPAASRLRARTSPRLQAAARALWRERLAPVSSDLAGVQRLVVIPSGDMLGVPVEALIDEESRVVGERFTVSYTPSVGVHAWLAQEKRSSAPAAERTALLLGDPSLSSGAAPVLASRRRGPMTMATRRGVLAGEDEALQSLWPLPWTRAEVEAIRPLFTEAEVLLGRDAAEGKLAELVADGRLGGFDLVHLATHALVDDERPERSALVLSQTERSGALEAVVKGEPPLDGLLSATEIIRGWRLDADLVTLSACETGLGRKVGGEGYIGFAYAFFRAGARSILVSLWEVSDEATSLLMQRFYENWQGAYAGERAGRSAEPMTKAQALKEAKSWMRTFSNEAGAHPFEHPYYWAGFILLGDPD